MPGGLWEIRVEIPAEAAGRAEQALLEGGLGAWAVTEDAVARRAWVSGAFAGRAEAESAWERLRPALPARPLGRGRPRRLHAADWARSYRRHFRPWTFGRLHWVPAWRRGSFRLPRGHRVLWLDPGLAFGTGNHETTRLCIERLVAFEAGLAAGRGAAAVRVVDAGCGSGILALSAALLGFGDVSGFDSDPEAVRASRANAQLNGLSGRVAFSEAALPAGLAGAPAGMVLANLQADVLLRHRRALVGAVAPGGALELSGILARELAGLRRAFAAAAPGWAIDSRILGEWSDLFLRRPARARPQEKRSGVVRVKNSSM